MKPAQFFGTNGIRGVVGQTITVNFAFRVGSSIGVLYPRQRVLVGRDGRSSSLMLCEAVIAGLLSHGNIVDDCGLITTPALQFLVKHTEAAAAVMVTASHNPPEYNGFKIIDSDGVEISRNREVLVERIIQQDKWQLSKNAGERVQRLEPFEPYFAELTPLVNNDPAAKRLRIVLDVGNGVAALSTPALLRRLGC